MVPLLHLCALFDSHALCQCNQLLLLPEENFQWFFAGVRSLSMHDCTEGFVWLYMRKSLILRIDFSSIVSYCPWYVKFNRQLYSKWFIIFTCTVSKNGNILLKGKIVSFQSNHHYVKPPYADSPGEVF